MLRKVSAAQCRSSERCSLPGRSARLRHFRTHSDDASRCSQVIARFCADFLASCGAAPNRYAGFQIATQSIWTLPAVVSLGSQQGAVSVWSTQCIGVFGIRLVEAISSLPSR